MARSRRPQNDVCQPSTKYSILRWRRDGTIAADDVLVVEEPLEIRARGKPISVTMRTPGYDDELAVGFLLTEGIIRDKADVLRVEPCDKSEEGNVINVQLAPQVHVDFARLTRHLFASSSCGICGKATIGALKSLFSPLDTAGDLSIEPQVLSELPALMRAQQRTFAETGGLHAAGVFSIDGTLNVMREDVGRHNAVDKVIGFGVLHSTKSLGRNVLVVSGRASLEIMQKALAAKIPIVASVSAPSSLAVDFARANGQTLAGFVRDARFNVYSHPERILSDDC